MFPNIKKESLLIICFGYRDWSRNIYKSLSENPLLNRHSFVLINNKKLVDLDFITSMNPDLILFYGWSDIVDVDIVERFCCLMLHPSPLPKYRGGSPIQNQIIDGKKESEVCIFKMQRELDAGLVIKRAKLDLRGELKEIFHRIELLGIQLSLEFLTKGFDPKPQIGNPTFYKRRNKEDSEITLKELKESSAEYLHNKIRMLNDPYPNAYIKCSDGKRLYITKSSVE